MRLQGSSVALCLALSLASYAPQVQGRLATEVVRRAEDGSLVHNSTQGHVQRRSMLPHRLSRRQISIGGDNEDEDDNNNGNGNGGGNNSAADDNASPTTTDDADASPTTGNNNNESPTTESSDGGVLDGLLGGNSESSESTSTSEQETSSSESETTTTSSSSSSSSSEEDSSSSESETVSSSTVSESGSSASVVDVTSTIDPSSSASAASSSDKDEDEDDSNGLSIGKTAMIVIIAVASGLGLIALVWTILRKWKFSPSRRFENRLNPIDWQPDADDQVKMANNGAGPNNDSMVTLDRADSWGSGTGSVRSNALPPGAPMAERSDAFSAISGGQARYAPSNIGSGYGAATPAYPPGYNPNPSTWAMPEYQRPYQPAQQPVIPNPYDQVSRQNTVSGGSVISGRGPMDGGRYGEGYGSINRGRY